MNFECCASFVYLKLNIVINWHLMSYFYGLIFFSVVFVMWNLLLVSLAGLS